MKTHFTPSAPPSAGIFNPQRPTVGGKPPIRLGGLTTLQGRSSGSLLTGVRFDAVLSCVAKTQAALA